MVYCDRRRSTGLQERKCKKGTIYGRIDSFLGQAMNDGDVDDKENGEMNKQVTFAF